jgi:HAD superfamily hydrolase (TIGR01509 family)
MIQGVLFDMDGVLVDSEDFICNAAVMMFKEKGLLVNKDDFIPFIGMGENRYLGGVAEKYGFVFDVVRDKKRTYEIYREITRGKLKPLKGVPEFIKKCRDKNLKIAVATSADEIKMQTNFFEIGIPSSTFDATVNGLEVERKKPFPDIYLEAATRLKINPHNCLVVEDALSGEKAGKNAGCKVLAVTGSFAPGEFLLADWKTSDLSLAPEECLEW